MAILGVAVLMILGSLYLSQVASFAITNREIEDLISRRDQLKRQNERLSAKSPAYRTVPRLYARAVEIGFRPATNHDIDYLLIEGYNPRLESAPVELGSPSQIEKAAPVYAETFRGWIERQFTVLREQFESFGE